MTYRSLLVLLDQDPRSDTRTQVAVQLARALDCHLAGLAPTGLLEVPAMPEAGAFGDLAAMAWDALRQQARKAADRFGDACRLAGLKSFEAVVDEADKAASLVRHAHCSDLTILTQADPQSPGHRQVQEVVEQVVLHSARPTLLLPHVGTPGINGRRVLAAWDDSREAARALSDALPLLRRAEQVQVVGWNEERHEPDALLQSRLDAVQRWLAWQGVPAEVRVETTTIGVGDALLSRACDVGADLIVMGAYGHHRLAERILGGATLRLLGSMTVPVLMSH
ncbi:universal stress protein [Aquincola sp. MAHUQ-54]|uniref:Universal stress protein n=1 Tax=Aquincola agrisoli TaxID=3119538 RepID=A0AAW9PZP6_9BURK